MDCLLLLHHLIPAANTLLSHSPLSLLANSIKFKCIYRTIYQAYLKFSIIFQVFAEAESILLRSQRVFQGVWIKNPCHLISTPVKPHECCVCDALSGNYCPHNQSWAKAVTAFARLIATRAGTGGLVHDGEAVHFIVDKGGWLCYFYGIYAHNREFWHNTSFNSNKFLIV